MKLIHKEFILLSTILLLSCMVVNSGYKGKQGTYSKMNGNSSKSVVVAVGDVNGDGLQLAAPERLDPDRVAHGYHLFYFKHAPIQKLDHVEVNAVTMPSTDPITKSQNYTYHPKNGWITFRQAFNPSDKVTVFYSWSNKLDVIAGCANQGTMLYQNNNNNSFSENGTFGSPNALKDVALANLQGGANSKSDAVLVYNDAGVGIHLNNGVGFNNSPNSSLSTPNPNAISIADMDGDGQLDVAVANGNGSLQVFQNSNGTSAGSFPNPVSMMTNFAGVTFGSPNPTFSSVGGGAAAQAIDFGDYDNDGKPDLLVGRANGDIEVWRNEPSGPSLWVMDYNFVLMKFDANNLTDTGVRIKEYDPVKHHQWMNTAPCGGATMNKPFSGVTVDGTSLYVCNINANTVVKLNKFTLALEGEVGHYNECADRMSNPVGWWDTRISQNPEQLFNPWDVMVDDSYLYIIDKNNYRVEKRDKNSLAYIGQTLLDYYSFGGDVGNRYLYVAQTYGNTITKIDKTNMGIVLTYPDPVHQTPENFVDRGTNDWGGPENPVYGYQHPVDCLVDANRLYVLDLFKHRIVTLDTTTLTMVSQFGSNGSGPGNFNFPYKFTMDDTSFYVADTYNGRLIRLKKSDYSYLGESPNGSLGLVYGVAYDPYINRNFRKICTLNNGGSVSQVQWADFDGDGYLDFVVTYNGSQSNVVYRNNNNGTFTKMGWAPSFMTTKGVSVADVNGDGKPDLVFANYDGAAAIKVFLNATAGSNISFADTWGSDLLTGTNQQYNNLQGGQVIAAAMSNSSQLDLIASAEDSAARTNEYTGIVYYQYGVSEQPVFVIKGYDIAPKGDSEQPDGQYGACVQITYAVNSDGTIGPMISSVNCSL